MAVGFTPIESRIVEVLSDGLPHKKEELHAKLSDELGQLKNVRSHICNIRKKLRIAGQDIVCEFRKDGFFYRQVRLLNQVRAQ